MKNKKNKNTTTGKPELPYKVQRKANIEAVTVCADTKFSSSGSDDPQYFAEQAREKGFDPVGAHRLDCSAEAGPNQTEKDRKWIAAQTEALSTSQEPKGPRALDPSVGEEILT